MKAIILNEFGGVENLIETEMDTPMVWSYEVLIRVKAISINPVDVRTRAGSAMAPHLKDYHPLILGWDISGEIVEVGDKISEFKIGDEVFGLINFLGHGRGYAEYVSSPAKHLAFKPKNISHGQAAAATLAALTAWQLLYHYAKLKSGDKILIQAASGGVGHYAVQIAKHLGAYVIGVASSKNRNFVLGLGADKFVAYDEVAFEDIPEQVDIVVDAFAKDNLFKSLKVVKPGGRIISLLPMISPEVSEEAMKKNVEIYYSLVKSSGIDMDTIASLLAQGVIKSYVSEEFPFDQMKLAHQKMETGKTKGKIIVSVP